MARFKIYSWIFVGFYVISLYACQTSDVRQEPEIPTSSIEATVEAPTPLITSPTPINPIAVPAIEQAEVIFLNGSILTMNLEQPRAEALAIKGDKIIAVGANDDVVRFEGPETRIFDLSGMALLPGFIDAHTHLLNDHEALGTDLAGAQDLALSNGITTLANMYSDEAFVGEMQRMDQAGELILRTNLYLAASDNCGEPTGDWWKNYPVTREPGARLRITGLKIFADGGTCGRLAGSQELLPGYGLGDLFFTQDEMNQFFEVATAEGYQLAVHAQGDRAVGQVLESFATVLGHGGNPLRHRIEHNALVRPEQRPLYSEYDVVATLFGYFTACDMPAWTDFYIEFGEDPRAMIDANPTAHFAWHGDDPWLPPISPLLDLASLVTRQDRRADGTFCDPPDWLKAKAITVEEALQLMTTGSAYALFREDEVGSLEVGKFADLVVLSADPTSVNPSELWDLELQMTIVGGEVVYCAPGSSGLCTQASVRERPPDKEEDTGSGGESGGIQASRSSSDAPPELALDGNTQDTSWISGEYAPQWIEIDLGSSMHVVGLNLWVEQDPAGFTRHRITGGDTQSPNTELAILEGETARGQLLEVEGDWTFRYVRIETLESPSWVAWLEIEVLTD